MVISPTSDARHSTIFDINALKPVADIIYRPTETGTSARFIPDQVVEVNGIRAREATQVIRDKTQILRLANKVSDLAGQEGALTPERAEFIGKNAPSLSEPKVAKAAGDVELYNAAQKTLSELRAKAQTATRLTFAPNSWRIKDVINPYSQVKFLNQYNYNPISRMQVDAQLEIFKQAAIQKFGLTDADFANAKVDLTPLLKGAAPETTMANTNLLVRTVISATPTAQGGIASQAPANFGTTVQPTETGYGLTNVAMPEQATNRYSLGRIASPETGYATSLAPVSPPASPYLDYTSPSQALASARPSSSPASRLISPSTSPLPSRSASPLVSPLVSSPDN